MKIDYQAEVKRVYPKMTAFRDHGLSGYFDFYISDGDGNYITNPFTLHDTEPEAWQSAYNKLIEQNKLTHKNEEV